MNKLFAVLVTLAQQTEGLTHRVAVVITARHADAALEAAAERALSQTPLENRFGWTVEDIQLLDGCILAINHTTPDEDI